MTAADRERDHGAAHRRCLGDPLAPRRPSAPSNPAMPPPAPVPPARLAPASRRRPRQHGQEIKAHRRLGAHDASRAAVAPRIGVPAAAAPLGRRQAGSSNPGRSPADPKAGTARRAELPKEGAPSRRTAPLTRQCRVLRTADAAAVDDAVAVIADRQRRSSPAVEDKHQRNSRQARQSTRDPRRCHH